MLNCNSQGLFQTKLPNGSPPDYKLNLSVQVYDIYSLNTIFTISKTITVLPDGNLPLNYKNVNASLNNVQEIIVQTISINNLINQQSIDFVSIFTIFLLNLYS